MKKFCNTNGKKVYRIKRMVEEYKCDICNSIIPIGTKSFKNKYFEVTTGHNDWGYDSIESRCHYDICPKCIQSFISKYLLDEKKNGTEYIDIETAYATDGIYDYFDYMEIDND